MESIVKAVCGYLVADWLASSYAKRPLRWKQRLRCVSAAE